MSFALTVLADCCRRTLVCMMLGMLMSLMSLTALAGEVVVVNAKTPTGAMTKEQISNIFLGKLTSFPEGTPATPANLPESSQIREVFYTKVTGKTSAQAKAHWARMSFTGKGTPPREFASSGDLKKAMARDLSLIGYLEKSAVDESVKIVFEIK